MAETKAWISGGLILVIFSLLGIVAFNQNIVDTELCGTISSDKWLNLTETVYFNSTFSAIARYYCPKDSLLTSNECLNTNDNEDNGCKWGARLSGTKRTVYVIVDPELPASNCTILGNDITCINSYGSIKSTYGTSSIDNSCFEVEASSYITSQDLDCALSVGENKIIKAKAELWVNISHTIKEEYLDNVTFSYTCVGDSFNFNQTLKIATCNWINGSSYSHSYLKGNQTTKTIWWNETRSFVRDKNVWYKDWKDVSSQFNKAKVGADDYFVVSNINWNQNAIKKLRFCASAKPEKQPDGKIGANVKIDIKCKRSVDTWTEAIQNERMFIVDPMINSTFNAQVCYNVYERVNSSNFQYLIAFNSTDSRLNLSTGDMVAYNNVTQTYMAWVNMTPFGLSNTELYMNDTTVAGRYVGLCILSNGGTTARYNLSHVMLDSAEFETSAEVTAWGGTALNTSYAQRGKGSITKTNGFMTHYTSALGKNTTTVFYQYLLHNNSGDSARTYFTGYTSPSYGLQFGLEGGCSTAKYCVDIYGGGAYSATTIDILKNQWVKMSNRIISNGTGYIDVGYIGDSVALNVTFKEDSNLTRTETYVNVNDAVYDSWYIRKDYGYSNPTYVAGEIEIFEKTFSMGNVNCSNVSEEWITSPVWGEILVDCGVSCICSGCTSGLYVNFSGYEGYGNNDNSWDTNDTWFKDLNNDTNISDRYYMSIPNNGFKYSGEWNITAVCSDGADTSKSNLTWQIPWGQVSVSLVTPSSNFSMQINTTRSATFNVSCDYECNTTGYLDPIKLMATKR